MIWRLLFGICCICTLTRSQGLAADHPGVVFVEGYDDSGRRLSIGAGIIVRKNFVAVNYHHVAGMDSVVVFMQGDSKPYVCNGYLTVEEVKDLLILSVPGVTGPSSRLSIAAFPEEGTEVEILDNMYQRQLKTTAAVVSGQKEIMDLFLPQLISRHTADCTGGPVFKGNEVIGFVTAGYLDDRYYAYVMPIRELRRIMNRSFIIKALNSLSDEKPIGTSYYQKDLLENLESVIWLTAEDAERLARKKGKMIMINVYTDWAGWSKLMDKNTYSRKRIIRYINENFYAVRLNAETDKSILFNKLTYDRPAGQDFHTLAYSLLEGIMDFPSTVFLDESIKVIMVIPGYMDDQKLEVVLHYFNEKAYENNKVTFTEFEREYLSRKDQY